MMRKRYVYKTLDHDFLLTDVLHGVALEVWLNSLGDDGWQVVQMATESSNRECVRVSALFMREETV